jgi:hypothetical protein
MNAMNEKYCAVAVQLVGPVHLADGLRVMYQSFAAKPRTLISKGSEHPRWDAR